MSFILGGCCFTIYPLSITQVCDKIDPIFTTYVTSVLSFTYGIGSIIGPIISPVFMDVISPCAIYLYIMLCGILLASLGTYYKINNIGIVLFKDKKKKVDYIPMPANPIAAKDLDPRVPEKNFILKEKKKDKEK